MKIIFFGNERLASAVEESGVILQSLIDAGHDVTHLFINQSSVQSRKKKTDAVVSIAEKNNIPIITSWDKEQVIELASRVDVGVLAAYGRIIPQSVIESFARGIINIHPSLLPKYRGSTPIESAILNGDFETGVSIMSLAKAMDAGDVYTQATLTLSGSESKQELYESLSKLGAQLVVDLLNKDEAHEAFKQEHANATYCPQISKQDGQISWDKTATILEREVRAYLDWPGSKTTLLTKDVTITKAKALNQSGKVGTFKSTNNSIIAYCPEGALEILALKPAGKNEMSAQAFLAGNPL